jgi:hypothetical protein
LAPLRLPPVLFPILSLSLFSSSPGRGRGGAAALLRGRVVSAARGNFKTKKEETTEGGRIERFVLGSRTRRWRCRCPRFFCVCVFSPSLFWPDRCRGAEIVAVIFGAAKALFITARLINIESLSFSQLFGTFVFAKEAICHLT